MRRAVCPGSFDPVTLGHLDIFERASHMFDEVIISVFVNPTKDKALFPMEERVALIEKATAHLPNVRVTSFSGLLNEFCRKEEAAFIVRGLRAFSLLLQSMCTILLCVAKPLMTFVCRRGMLSLCLLIKPW